MLYKSTIYVIATINWDRFTERLAILNIPIYTHSIGFQSNLNDTFEISESSISLIKGLGRKNSKIFCRGDITASIVKKYASCVVFSTVCPSVLFNFDKIIKENSKDKMVINSDSTNTWHEDGIHVKNEIVGLVVENFEKTFF